MGLLSEDILTLVIQERLAVRATLNLYSKGRFRPTKSLQVQPATGGSLQSSAGQGWWLPQVALLYHRLSGYRSPPDPSHLQLQSVRNTAGSQLFTRSLYHVHLWPPSSRGIGTAALTSVLPSSAPEPGGDTVVENVPPCAKRWFIKWPVSGGCPSLTEIGVVISHTVGARWDSHIKLCVRSGKNVRLC